MRHQRGGTTREDCGPRSLRRSDVMLRADTMQSVPTPGTASTPLLTARPSPRARLLDPGPATRGWRHLQSPEQEAGHVLEDSQVAICSS